jgi:hypothetical protein
VIALPPMPGTAQFSGNGDDMGELLASSAPQIKQMGRI